MSLRTALLAALVLGVVTFATAVDGADARRACSPWCGLPQPVVEGVPQACRVRTFTVDVTVRRPARARRLVVRIDGRALVARGPSPARVRVSCRELKPGTHRLRASVRSNIGTKHAALATFTVLPPLEPAAPAA